MKFGTGQSVKRSEDVRFVTGHGQYTDDLRVPNTAHSYVLRSPHAHAKLGRIDPSAALASPGVLAVITGKQLAEMKIGPLSSMGALPGDGKMVTLPDTPQPILALDKVRYVGAPVAFVVAETYAQAKDAAELIEVEYEPLSAAGTIDAALAPDAPQIWAEAPGNLCFDWQVGDAEGVNKALAAAAHVAEVSVYQNRVVPTPMEPRNALGEFHAAESRYVLHTATQGSNQAQRIISGILGVRPEQLRVVTPDVGGGFGMKNFTFPEQPLVLIAAKQLGRPVKWQGDRSEAFLADSHGRGFEGKARLALDEEGKILALNIDFNADLGAFKHQFGPFIPTLAGARIWGGVYKIPIASARVKGAYTNTMGVDAYRGAGRPEGAYMIERLMNEAGRITGLGPIEIRKRNFMRPADFPYKNWRGVTFDSGDFAKNLDDAAAASSFANFERRRIAARARGKLRGIGISYYVEITAAGQERSEVRFTDNGGVQLIVGTQSNGQGHETTYAQILADELGIPFESITVVQGDTDWVPTGGGTGGSRSVVMTSGSTRLAVSGVIDKGTKVAAHLLDTQPSDIKFDKSGEVGLFRAQGSNRTVSLPEVAVASLKAQLPPDLKQELGPSGIGAFGIYQTPDPTLPNGCHIAEVEIDIDTGVPQLVDYWVVDDFGKIINPMVVEGQVQGGIVQGIGQALLEHARYDAESGQLMTGSFMDYAMPRASDVPPIHFKTNEFPAPHNPFGLKGCGEAGTVGALGAVTNAVVDALKDYGVTDIEMPAVPEKLWRLIQAGRRAA